MADSYYELGYSSAIEPNIAYPKAMAAASRALALDDSPSYAHTIRGWVYLAYQWDWAAAEQELRRAISLDPADSDARHGYSHYLVAMGRFPESLEESKRGIELDPLNGRMHAHLVWHYLFGRDFNAAIIAGEKGLEIDPHHGPTLFYLRCTYEQIGNFEKAIEMGQQSGTPPERVAELRQALTTSGARGYWRASIDQVLQSYRQQYGRRYRMARRYAYLDDPDHAFEWLERAYEDRDSWLIYLKVDPRWIAIAPTRALTCW